METRENGAGPDRLDLRTAVGIAPGNSPRTVPGPYPVIGSNPQSGRDAHSGLGATLQLSGPKVEDLALMGLALLLLGGPLVAAFKL